MQYCVHFSADVDQDLHDIKAYLNELSVHAADRVTTEIIDQALALANFPYRCRIIREGSTKRRLLVGNYSVFYEVYEEIKTVQILFVWHQSRNTGRLT